MVAKWEGATGSFRTNPPSCTYAVTKFPQYLAVSSVAHEQVGTHTHMSSKARPMALFGVHYRAVHFRSIAKLSITQALGCSLLGLLLVYL